MGACSSTKNKDKAQQNVENNADLNAKEGEENKTQSIPLIKAVICSVCGFDEMKKQTESFIKWLKEEGGINVDLKITEADKGEFYLFLIYKNKETPIFSNNPNRHDEAIKGQQIDKNKYNHLKSKIITIMSSTTKDITS